LKLVVIGKSKEQELKRKRWKLKFRDSINSIRDEIKKN
jgi:hypothetical protein